jgi:hypothetical protein
MQQLFFLASAQYFIGQGADEKTGVYTVFLSAREADKTNYDYFRRSLRPTKLTIFFSSAVLSDENMVYIFVGCLG